MIEIVQKQRCFANKPDQVAYATYHDDEWGVPCHDDRKLFEMLILEGAQAGLSWETILLRRAGYRKVFLDFDVAKVAKLTDSQIEDILLDKRIIRNRLKVNSTRLNARIFRQIQKESSSFSDYIWSYVDGKQQVNCWQSREEVPVNSDVSSRISKDLKSRGMKFVGPTIIYSYMQAIGMLWDHLCSCPCYKNHENYS